MPPKIDKEIVFFLANVGKQPTNGDLDYVEKAKEVMKLITEKKIYLRPKDEIGVFLAGDKKNKPEASITLLHRNEVPTWEMVEDILAIEKSDQPFKDWHTAFSKVLEHLSENISASRIILILLFDCDATCPEIDSIDVDSIAGSVRKLGIQLLWIGSKQIKDVPPEKLNQSESRLMEIVELAQGEYMPIDKTLTSLRIFKKHKARFVAWRCPLEIGTIMIPTATYVQAVDDMKEPSFKTVNTAIEGDIVTSTAMGPARDYVDRHREAHSLADTIPGYMYGRKFIPVPESDEASMKFDTGPKSLKISGFTSRSSVKLEDLAGDSSRIVLPDGLAAEKPFYCMAEAMVKDDLVAIVRRVYQSTLGPKMGVLIPRINVPDEPACFILIELLFAEDRRVVQSCPLNSVTKNLTKEKKDLVANLVEAMMLPGTVNEGEEFAPGTVPSPGLQHLWNSLTHRALNPNAPVKPMDENLKKLLEPPDSIKIESEPLLKRVKEVFGIKDVQDASKPPQDTSAQVPDPMQSEVTKMESIIKKSMEESIFRPEESNVDLDELFDGEMEI